jgi:hypothetical protein
VEDSFSSRAPNEFGLSHDAAIVAAKTARLRYVNDRRPGIVRERNGKGFVYRDYTGAIIADPDELARIKMNSHVSMRSRCRRHGRGCGFVRILMATSKPLAATRAAANSIATMRGGEASGTTQSSSTC